MATGEWLRELGWIDIGKYRLREASLIGGEKIGIIFNQEGLWINSGYVTTDNLNCVWINPISGASVIKPRGFEAEEQLIGLEVNMLDKKFGFSVRLSGKDEQVKREYKCEDMDMLLYMSEISRRRNLATVK